MGEYTEFYGKIQFRKGLKKQLLDEEGDIAWHKLMRIKGIRNHPDVKAFRNKQRYWMLRGQITDPTDNRSVFNPEWYKLLLEGKTPDSYLFHCSIKNYCGSIEALCKILPLLADSWHLFSLEDFVADERYPDEHKPLKSTTLIRHLPDYFYPNPEFLLHSSSYRKLVIGEYLYSVVTVGKARPPRQKCSHVDVILNQTF